MNDTPQENHIDGKPLERSFASVFEAFNPQAYSQTQEHCSRNPISSSEFYDTSSGDDEERVLRSHRWLLCCQILPYSMLNELFKSASEEKYRINSYNEVFEIRNRSYIEVTFNKELHFTELFDVLPFSRSKCIGCLPFGIYYIRVNIPDHLIPSYCRMRHVL